MREVSSQKGWFALDIDGTLTEGIYSIPKKVISYLKEKQLEGWQIIVLTGRPYHFALSSVEGFDFPFILSIQNGSSAFHMPNKTLIFKNFLKKEFFTRIEKETKETNLALIAYGEDFNCYCRNNEKYDDYIDSIVALGDHQRIRFDDAEKVKVPQRFSLVKLAGPYNEIIDLRDYLEKIDLCESSVIKDPFYENFYLLLLTNRGVSKGSCIDKIKAMHGEGIVIAAGNDRNDLSMFQKADISIAMEDSPEDVLQKADIIAPSSDKHGVIQGLEAAIALAFSERKRPKRVES